MIKLSVILIVSVLASAFAASEILYDRPESWQNNQNVTFQNGIFTLQGRIQFLAKDMVKVEPRTKYTLVAELRNPQEKKLPGICLAVVIYDDQGKQIHSRHYLTMPGTETELVAPIHMTDSVLTVRTNRRWKMHKHWNLAVAFDIEPDGSDLPNSKVSTEIEAIKGSGAVSKVTLSNPLYAEFPAGTNVRLHHAASFYLPCPVDAWYNRASKNWKQIGGTVQVPANAHQFRPAVIYYDNSTKSVDYFELRNIKLIIQQVDGKAPDEN